MLSQLFLCGKKNFSKPTVPTVQPVFEQRSLSRHHKRIQYWSESTSRSKFQDVISQISVVQGLMGSSHMDKKLLILERKMQTLPLNEPAENTFAEFVATAFDLKSPKKGKCYCGSGPGGFGVRGNVYSACKILHENIQSWQRPLLHAALHEIISQRDVDRDGLQILCGLILRASKYCNAVKQDVFFKVIQHSISNDEVNLQSQRANEAESIEYHKKILFDAAMIPIDEIKENAFKLIFLEPIKMYFRAVNDDMEGHVDIHGSNTYLAILLATLGVKLSRVPFLNDLVLGVAEIKEGLRGEDLNLFWTAENKGASWEMLIGKSYISYEKTVRANKFYVSGHNAKEVARRCNKTSKHRKSIKPYLQAYASHFEKEKIVDILCKYFLSQDNLHHHLDVLFSEVASKDEVEASNGEAMYWLWDVMTGEFHSDRAYNLLSFAGILKEGI